MITALHLYRTATILAGPALGLWLRARVGRGKEDPARLAERFGRASRDRPPGRLFWLHAASVGESGVALQLADGLLGRNATAAVLITTGTRTGAAKVEAAANQRIIHQFSPLDRPDAVRRFLEHWRPDWAVFVESEIWPNQILAAKAHGAALALVNARMSPAALANWKRAPKAARKVFSAFQSITTADARTAAGLLELGARRAVYLGNIKFAAPAPPIDVMARAWLAKEIRDRPVWLAASTHRGEEEIVLEAHAQVRRALPDALLLLAPRHPERGQEIAALAEGAPRRSLNQTIGAAPVYIADTMGEMGALYAVASVALVAGSLRPELKGHNPMEPAKIGAAVLTGPYVESFEEAYEALFRAGGARVVDGAARIASAVVELWRDEPARQRLVAAAGEVAGEAGPALAATLEALQNLKPEAPYARP
ncbi:MAG: 3-deoxy-D-manno-octulosonic acid transferase [Alphaproteobacteria bacterium]|nr:3-deoxy-D-manno-octulosonic acid transferase [Alphaproteobacteria bacterium]